MAKKIAETPMMKQYMEFKAKHPDAILLLRMETRRHSREAERKEREYK